MQKQLIERVECCYVLMYYFQFLSLINLIAL